MDCVVPPGVSTSRWPPGFEQRWTSARAGRTTGGGMLSRGRVAAWRVGLIGSVVSVTRPPVSVTAVTAAYASWP